MQTLSRGNTKILPEVFKERKKVKFLEKIIFSHFFPNNSALQITSFLILYLFSDLLPPGPSSFFLYIFLFSCCSCWRKEGTLFLQEKSRNSLPQKLPIQQLFKSHCLCVRLRNSNLIRTKFNHQLQAQAEAPAAASEHLWVHGYFGMGWHPHPILMSHLGTGNGITKTEITAQR